MCPLGVVNYCNLIFAMLGLIWFTSTTLHTFKAETTTHLDQSSDTVFSHYIKLLVRMNLFWYELIFRHLGMLYKKKNHTTVQYNILWSRSVHSHLTWSLPLARTDLSFSGYVWKFFFLFVFVLNCHQGRSENGCRKSFWYFNNFNTKLDFCFII